MAYVALIVWTTITTPDFLTEKHNGKIIYSQDGVTPSDTLSKLSFTLNSQYY